MLTIREVDASDSGKYMCSAVNKAGEVTQGAVLEVIGKNHNKLACEFEVHWVISVTKMDEQGLTTNK